MHAFCMIPFIISSVADRLATAAAVFPFQPLIIGPAWFYDSARKIIYVAGSERSNRKSLEFAMHQCTIKCSPGRASSATTTTTTKSITTTAPVVHN